MSFAYILLLTYFSPCKYLFSIYLIKLNQFKSKLNLKVNDFECYLDIKQSTTCFKSFLKEMKFQDNPFAEGNIYWWKDPIFDFDELVP